MVAHVGTFAAATSVGAQAVTGIGFTPKLVIIWGNRLATSDPEAVAGGDYALGFGASDGVTDVCFGLAHVDATLTMRSVKRDDRVVHIVTGAGVLSGSATMASLDADGFTLDWVNATTGGMFLQYLALGGDDITDVKVATHDFVTSIGAHAVTGVGFQPDFVMGMFGHKGAFNTEEIDGALFSISVSDGVRAAALAFKNANSILKTASAQVQNAPIGPPLAGFIAVYNNTSSSFEEWIARLDSFDVDGFTYTVMTTFTAPWPSLYIAVKGGDFFVSDMEVTPAGIGTQALSGFGFEPEAAMFFSVGAAIADSVAGNPPTVAAASAPDERAFTAWFSQDGGAHNAGRSQRSDRMVDILDRSDLTMSATLEEADLDSIDADGITLDWTKANAKAVEFFVLAMRTGAATPPPAGGRAGRFLPPGWGGPAPPPRGTGPRGPGDPAPPSNAPPGTAPGYGKTHPDVRARQIADALCDQQDVDPRRHQSLQLSLTQILHCLQGRPLPRAPQSAERSLELIFRELGVVRPRRVTLAQELDVIALNLP